jgi:hypothetical protein
MSLDSGGIIKSVERTAIQATVYVDAPDADELAELLESSLGATVEGGTLVTPILDLDVIANDDAKSGGVHEEDTFLYFPSLIEAFTVEARAEEQVVGAVAGVLAALDDLGLRYVTAADFEEDLPRRGRSGT